jgi:hypothetical protein
MTTFSLLVDELTTEVVRPDLRSTIATYVNQTVREMHFRPGINTLAKFDANRFEDELTFTTEGMWLWALPSATRFQDIEALFINDLGLYVPKRSPRIALEPSFEPNPDLYWYRSGAQIAINGVANGWTGKISYFMFVKTLAYKTANQRTIEYDKDTDTYSLVGGGTPTEEQLEVETHWLLQRHGECVKEGTRAKLYKRLADESRARMAFSAFESMRTGVTLNEPSS